MRFQRWFERCECVWWSNFENCKTTNDLVVRSILHHHGESEGLFTQTQSVCCQDRSQHSVYWTIRVKVKDYSHRHQVFVVRTEVINTQYIEQSGWKWWTTHTQSVCCQNRSQHSVYWTIRVKVKDYSRGHKVGVVWTEVNTQDPGAMTWQCSSQVGVLSEKERKTHPPLNFWQQSGQVEMSMLASGTKQVQTLFWQ